MGEPVPRLSWLAQAVALHQLAEHTVIFKRDRAMIVTPEREGSMGWSAAEDLNSAPGTQALGKYVFGHFSWRRR